MKSLSQKILLAVLMAAVAIGVLWELVELPTAKMRLAQLPLVSGTVIGRQIGMTDTEREIFKDAYVIKRFYNVRGQKCFVTILDGTRNRHAVHDPFYCFRGDGWTLVEKVPLPIPGGTAHILRMEKNGTINEALYWFSDGQKRHSSMFVYLWQTTVRRLTLGRSGEEPIRVMIHPLESDTLEWDKLADAFPELFEI